MQTRSMQTRSMQTRSMQTRSMLKKERFNNSINLLPYEIEISVLSYLKDDLTLNWDDVINKDNYKKFKKYVNTGMGMSFKSEKLIRKCYISWIKSHKCMHARQSVRIL